MRRTPVILRGSPVARMRTSVPSPIQSLNIHDLGQVAGMIQEIVKLHESIVPMMKSVIEAKNAFNEIKKGPQGAPGVPGTSVNHEAVVSDVLKKIRKPQDGKSPAVEAIAAALYPLILTYVKKNLPKPQKGKDGKDATAPEFKTEEIMNMVFDALEKGDKKLKIEHIAGLDGKFAEVRSAAALNTPAVYGKDTWARGGGDTVVAGTGVTIVPTKNGTKQINVVATGSTLSSEIPAGVIDGSNNIFTVTHTPVFVMIDGNVRVNGYGYTYAAGTITVDPLLAPTQSIVSFYNA